MQIKRFKPIYLLFLALPLMLYILRESGTRPPPSQQQGYFYFSARCSKPTTLSLFAGKDSLTSWQINSPGYKYMDYGGNLKGRDALSLKIYKAEPGDSISFLAFNLYRDNKVYSLYKQEKISCPSGNATMRVSNNALSLIHSGSEKAIELLLPGLSEWESSHSGRWIDIVFGISLLLTFILIVRLAPPLHHFIIYCVLSLMCMLLFYWVGQDFQSSVTLNTSSPSKGIQIFYNNSPGFLAGKMHTCDITSNSFSAPVDLATDKFIRCDIDGSQKETGKVNYKMNVGLFHCSFDLATLPRNKLMMNDLSIQDGIFRVTGNDPYFVLTSDYFISQINWMILLQKRLFLFMGLIVFILLLCFHPWLLRIHGKHFQPVYLVFLVIPVTYYFLSNIGLNEKPKEQKDLFYFSIRTTHPALVELKDAGATIASWQLNSSGYKYLQYSGNPINNATGLSLSINNLAASDTLSLLSANVFHDNQLYSLYKDHASQCLITNAALISMSGALDAVVHSSGKPVGISLPSFYAWHTTHPANNLRIYLILAFILVLVIVLVLAPTMKRFLISCSLAWVLMILAYWATNYMYYEVGMQTGCPVTNVQFFYNNHPSFDRFKNIELNLCATFFRSEINLSDNNYLRCDINESEKVLKHFHVITKAGYLQNDMDFGHIPPDKMLLNDMTFSHGSFIITGDDPFFCLTSSYFTGHLQWLLIMHKNLYLLISLGVIILILIFDPNRFPIRKEKKL